MSSDVSQEELTEIVERAREGSLEDFQRLYSLFAKPIFNFIWRLAGSPDDAEDLTQDTFLKVYSELKNLREPAQFRFWLYRIARNEVYQKLRKSQRKTEISLDSEDSPLFNILADESIGLDPEKVALSRELNEVIDTALSSLKPKYRDVFVLAVFEKMTYEDISKVVGRTLLSVKTDIYRGRLAIKEAITSYMKEKQ